MMKINIAIVLSHAVKLSGSANPLVPGITYKNVDDIKVCIQTKKKTECEDIRGKPQESWGKDSCDRNGVTGNCTVRLGELWHDAVNGKLDNKQKSKTISANSDLQCEHNSIETVSLTRRIKCKKGFHQWDKHLDYYCVFYNGEMYASLQNKMENIESTTFEDIGSVCVTATETIKNEITKPGEWENYSDLQNKGSRRCNNYNPEFTDGLWEGLNHLDQTKLRSLDLHYGETVPLRHVCPKGTTAPYTHVLSCGSTYLNQYGFKINKTTETLAIQRFMKCRWVAGFHIIGLLVKFIKMSSVFSPCQPIQSIQMATTENNCDKICNHVNTDKKAPSYTKCYYLADKGQCVIPKDLSYKRHLADTTPVSGQVQINEMIYRSKQAFSTVGLFLESRWSRLKKMLKEWQFQKIKQGAWVDNVVNSCWSTKVDNQKTYLHTNKDMPLCGGYDLHIPLELKSEYDCDAELAAKDWFEKHAEIDPTLKAAFQSDVIEFMMDEKMLKQQMDTKKIINLMKNKMKTQGDMLKEAQVELHVCLGFLNSVNLAWYYHKTPCDSVEGFTGIQVFKITQSRKNNKNVCKVNNYLFSPMYKIADSHRQPNTHEQQLYKAVTAKAQKIEKMYDLEEGEFDYLQGILDVPNSEMETFLNGKKFWSHGNDELKLRYSDKTVGTRNLLSMRFDIQNGSMGLFKHRNKIASKFSKIVSALKSDDIDDQDENYVKKINEKWAKEGVYPKFVEEIDQFKVDVDEKAANKLGLDKPANLVSTHVLKQWIFQKVEIKDAKHDMEKHYYKMFYFYKGKARPFGDLYFNLANADVGAIKLNPILKKLMKLMMKMHSILAKRLETWIKRLKATKDMIKAIISSIFDAKTGFKNAAKAIAQFFKNSLTNWKTIKHNAKFAFKHYKKILGHDPIPMWAKLEKEWDTLNKKWWTKKMIEKADIKYQALKKKLTDVSSEELNEIDTLLETIDEDNSQKK